MLLKRWEALEVKERKIHLDVVNQYGISPGICVTLVLFAFVQLSLVMVAMITRCLQLKILTMWLSAFMLLSPLLAALAPHSCFSMDVAHSFNFDHIILTYKHNLSSLGM